jgi:hypothetical protein
MRSGLLLRGLLGAAIAGLAFAALAQPAGALEISKHAKDNAETNAIQLKGRIDDGDTYELQVYIAGLAKKPNVVVYLNSAGGNLREGMRLGRFFFQNKIETVVESKTQCASACALAFLGGRDESGKPRRTKASTGGVGFHSFTREFDKDKNYSSDDLKTVVQMTQNQVAVVAEYLKAVNADLDLLRVMLRAAANEMNYLSNDDALAANIRIWDEKRNQMVEPDYVVGKLDRAQAVIAPTTGASSTATEPRPVSAKADGKSRSL